MASVNGLTAEEMRRLSDEQVIDGDIVNGRLILTRRSNIKIDAGSVVGPTGPVGPTGMIMMYAADTPPAGFLLCDGSSVSRTTYPKLFQTIGTTYGSGNGSTTFTLPDFKGNFPIGRNPGDTTVISILGSSGGSPDHYHGLNGNRAYVNLEITDQGSILGIQRNGKDSWTATTRGTLTPVGGTVSGRTTGMDVAGRTEAQKTYPPFLVVNYIIKAD